MPGLENLWRAASHHLSRKASLTTSTAPPKPLNPRFIHPPERNHEYLLPPLESKGLQPPRLGNRFGSTT